MHWEILFSFLKQIGNFYCEDHVVLLIACHLRNKTLFIKK